MEMSIADDNPRLCQRDFLIRTGKHVVNKEANKKHRSLFTSLDFHAPACSHSLLFFFFGSSVESSHTFSPPFVKSTPMKV
jgi:hypothetical protein